MTQVEFEKRVEMKVSSNEFDAINTVYMASDLDKDEFCKMWVKMNKSRIQAFKEEEKKQELISKVLDIQAKSLCFQGEDWWKLGIEILSKKEIEILKEFGIEMEGVSSWTGVRYFKTCSDLFFEISNKFAA